MTLIAEDPGHRAAQPLTNLPLDGRATAITRRLGVSPGRLADRSDAMGDAGIFDAASDQQFIHAAQFILALLIIPVACDDGQR